MHLFNFFSTKTKRHKRSRREKKLPCYLSNDNISIDSSHMYHFFKRHMFQSNFSSPIEDKLIQGECKVLDIGCGPGTWLLDISNKYENSYFFGIDIKSLFPQEIKPNNLEFIEADLFEGLPFCDNEFDFVHMDSMSIVLTKDKWDFILSELIRVTKPGGYIEIAEARNEYVGEGPVFHKLMETFYAFYLKRNMDIKSTFNLGSKLESFPNITKVYRDEKSYILGPNGDKIGLVCQDVVLSFFTSTIEAMVESLSDELKISGKEFKNMIENDLVEELKKTSPENRLIRFWAQKE